MSRPFSTESVFRALAHRTRRAIIDSLRGGERSAGDLLTGVAGSAPTVSEHLRILRECGLVSTRRRGTRLIYSLEVAALRDVATWLARIQRRTSAR